jgi:FAD:protein FMN transferase
MGTRWQISVWDSLGTSRFNALCDEIMQMSEAFDRTYSRFRSDSLVWSLTKQKGIVEVPHDLVMMLRLYETLSRLSDGSVTPTIGFALSDLGYDAEYRLRPRSAIRSVPRLQEALSMIDDTHIDLHASVLLDLGALGKGYFVDQIVEFLDTKGIKRFLVDGSGDIFYRGAGVPIRAGLEDPEDPTKAIGVLMLHEGALCASASNRRRWGTYHHTIDPFTLTSPEMVQATWVISDTCAMADGLATALFLRSPQAFSKELPFDYAILGADRNVTHSSGFDATFFSA